MILIETLGIAESVASLTTPVILPDPCPQTGISKRKSVMRSAMNAIPFIKPAVFVLARWIVYAIGVLLKLRPDDYSI